MLKNKKAGDFSPAFPDFNKIVLTKVMSYHNNIIAHIQIFQQLLLYLVVAGRAAISGLLVIIRRSFRCQKRRSVSACKSGSRIPPRRSQARPE